MIVLANSHDRINTYRLHYTIADYKGHKNYLNGYKLIYLVKIK